MKGRSGTLITVCGALVLLGMIAVYFLLLAPDPQDPTIKPGIADRCSGSDFDPFDSDYERRLALQAASARVAGRDTGFDAYCKAVSTMESSYEARLALQALVEERSLDAHSAAAAIQASTSIESSYERRLALVSIVENMPRQADLIDRARSAARDLSDYERGQVDKALDTKQEEIMQV